jgi:hypothetical protein
VEIPASSEPVEDRGFGKCGCGQPADKFSSNRPECWPCWYWRKLDWPAAEHWERVAGEFLSNVDMYDLMTYLPACGLERDEVFAMLRSVRAVLEYSKRIRQGSPHVHKC